MVSANFFTESRSSSPSHLVSPLSSRRSSCEEIVIFPSPEKSLTEPHFKDHKKVRIAVSYISYMADNFYT